MYCKNCGKEVDDKAVICTNCGVPISQNDVVKTQSQDDGNFGWGVLGCCVPIVGLVLFLVWKDTKPRSSKNAGIGAIVGVLSIVALYVFFFLFALGMARSSMYYYY